MADASVWLKRVQAWRASGLTAMEFSIGQDFSAGTLRSWAYKLGKKKQGASRAAGFVRLVPRPEPSARGGSLTIELGGARVTVGAGSDVLLLREVLELLRGAETPA